MHPAIVTKNLAEVAAEEAAEVLDHLCEIGITCRVVAHPAPMPAIRVIVPGLTEDLRKRLRGLLCTVDAEVVFLEGGPAPRNAAALCRWFNS
ncbi:hypothetical protein M446_4300 [Methylobacterium sp. 4-46]|uniref:hypothetical protein n=1 Tax=Methylobacterium sp. (strain 4-46) TaxID=426117 RepID=UPI000152C4C6|nr:hypothetical protein [Methylobacterium sp. 4-46]ACA18646.1 hypothetical protein M446_4300 [Methylobacterium sp. 4-46]